ncbi:DNA repair protein RAD16 [Penicillium longicatenatum]|uniref:DNA repair protein RAD16 n=1 Tax=Penicillium longicatenatum TaxID=1561947 RepID=UPI002546A527|nr:DNA repair protein RAD16 [Penicillium longicatenatum]KAJ5630525.1 DNA repair protein RAD16 [Penicillium longicatenatum]
MRTRRSIIPDSEDGFLSATSLKSSSPVRQLDHIPVGGSSRSKSATASVIKDSEVEGSDTLDLPDPAKNQYASGRVKVVIPAQKDESPVDSSRSSLGVLSADGVTGFNTPATSVSAAAETDSNKPRARVNASARAQQLRTSRMSRATQGGVKRSVDETSLEAMDRSALDAAVALALQMGEYDQPRPKRRKIATRSTRANISAKGINLDEYSDLESLSGDSDLSESPLDRLSDPEDLTNWCQSVDSDTDEDEDEDFAFPTENTSARRAPNRVPPTPVYAEYDEDGEELPPTWEEERKLRRKQADRKKLEKQHPTISTMWDDLKAQPIIAPKQAKQPESITRKLKPFQLEGLRWMMEQEKTAYHGGLLGDEMGMGKTIQAVSLIMSDYPQPDPTLVLVPPVALMQWVSEIKEYTDGKLKVLVYHGSDSKVRKLTPTDIRKYDVIMISYSSLESMFRKQEKGWARTGGVVKEDKGVIHSIHYHRLVLDEAHSIKQRTTGVAKACFALQATYKWCLSGTPVQNRIGEFFSLLRFLQVRPFACYFCKQCNCQQLQWTANKQGRCTECNHTGFNHISIFNKEILNPITEGRTQEERKSGLTKLRLITDHIMLRRMKQEHTSSMELPPKRIIIRNEFFGEIEHDFSRSIMTNSTRKFDTYVSQGVMLNNYANIFGLIMQMRQVANHPDLILKKHVQPGFNVLVCRVCDEPAEDAIRSRCRHEFCRKCVKDYIQSFDEITTVDCPQCHIALSIDLEQPTIEQAEESVKKNSIINRIHMEDWTSSTKIETLVYELYQQRNKSHTPKSIIFSQFTSMLQLVEWRLRHAGFNTVMLDGTMTPAQRQKSIEHFMKNADVEVFLVSLKAGGVALNLTEASRVFIVDPWWNPAAEWQSADRSHRIGQQRPCVITRLSIEDSVESRIVQLQEKKANLIRGTINKDQDQALEKLTPEDMQFLFRGT